MSTFVYVGWVGGQFDVYVYIFTNLCHFFRSFPAKFPYFSLNFSLFKEMFKNLRLYKVRKLSNKSVENWAEIIGIIQVGVVVINMST